MDKGGYQKPKHTPLGTVWKGAQGNQKGSESPARQWHSLSGVLEIRILYYVSVVSQNFVNKVHSISVLLHTRPGTLHVNPLFPSLHQ